MIHLFTTILLLLLVQGCAAPGHSLDLFNNPSEATRTKVAQICEKRSGLTKPPGRLLVDGYYIERTSPMFGARQVLQKLTIDRYQFLEMDSEWVMKVGGWSPFSRRLFRGEGKYTRFYIAEAGDPNCAAYESYLKHSRNDKTCAMRARGVYPEHCIAAVRTDELKSKYGIFVRYEPDKEMVDIEWRHSFIRNLETNEIYVGYKSFNYCWKGRRENGLCKGGSEQRYRCPDIPRGTDKCETKLAILYCILKSNPNPYLKKKVEVVEIDEPLSIPIDRVQPELIETVTDKTKIKEVRGDDYFDLYMPDDNEGSVWFESKKRLYTKDGRKAQMHVLRLAILQDAQRKLLRVDLNLGEDGSKYHPRVAGKVGFLESRYSNLRAIEGDAVYFIITPQFQSKDSSKFWILRCSWRGRPLRVTAGELPFPLHKRGEYSRYYTNLQILPNEYRFSILEDSSGYPLSEPFQAQKEYKFRIPFK